MDRKLDDLIDILEKISKNLEFIKNTLVDMEETQRDSLDILQELESIMREVDLS